MLTLSEIRSRVRTRYEASSSTRWSSADIDDAINDGLGELSDATGYYEQWVSIPLKENRTYYDLRGWLRPEHLSITGVWHQANNRWLEPMSHRDLDQERKQWELTAGGPTLWFTRGLWWLGLFPHPSEDVDQTVRVYYTAAAQRLTDDSHEPKQLPDEFIPALEEYALYELTQREGETEKALYWYGKYKAREADLAKHMAHRISTARTGSIGRA